MREPDTAPALTGDQDQTSDSNEAPRRMTRRARKSSSAAAPLPTPDPSSESGASTHSPEVAAATAPSAPAFHSSTRSNLPSSDLGVGLGIAGMGELFLLPANQLAQPNPPGPSLEPGRLVEEPLGEPEQAQDPDYEPTASTRTRRARKNKRPAPVSDDDDDDSENDFGGPKSTNGKLPRGYFEGVPAEGPFAGQPTVQILPCTNAAGSPVVVSLSISCQRAFFKDHEEGDFLIYRRNYMEIRCAVDARDAAGNLTENLKVEIEGEAKEVPRLLVEVRAVDGKTAPVDLIQGTSRRDGPTTSPGPVPITIGGNPFDDFQVPKTKPSPSAKTPKVAFLYRLVFKTATPNNDSTTVRAELANTYSLLLDLLGELADGTLVHIAQVHSQPIVVRGRSPSHYAKMAQKIKAGLSKGKPKRSPLVAFISSTRPNKTPRVEMAKEFDSEDDAEGEDIPMDWERTSSPVGGAGSFGTASSSPAFMGTVPSLASTSTTPSFSNPSRQSSLALSEPALVYGYQKSQEFSPMFEEMEMSPTERQAELDRLNQLASMFQAAISAGSVSSSHHSGSLISETTEQPQIHIQPVEQPHEQLGLQLESPQFAEDPTFVPVVSSQVDLRNWASLPSPIDQMRFQELVPDRITTDFVNNSLAEQQQDRSAGSNSNSSERLLSAASMFLQSSGSLFIDWTGGAANKSSEPGSS